ncbi:MAG: leucine--tRNA ligase [Christensenellales bacterium]|jgi:leucyl-tRNA synthetase
MDVKSIEEKWRQKWNETKLYAFDPSRAEEKYYCLEMFSYPSASQLHLGHWYNFGPTDSFARFKRMQGKNVFHPMGFDAFGLPAENYAIKTGIHPKDSTMANIETMREQLRVMGATFNWDYEVVTCDPSYYKWTQWMFLQLYKHGLAERREAPVNWCPSCNTVLANEQVMADGTCERCESVIVKRNLTQWFFKITAYAEQLLQDLEKINWPEKTKQMQRNWIGKSVGSQIDFKIDGHDEVMTVFTTRADTLFGCTYAVLAPEHPLLDKITAAEQKKAVDAYREAAAKTSEIDRLSTANEKTGVFTGAHAVNPINGRKIPLYTADYVLYSYGTGAVMAVPGHDERDFEFAQKYDLPIERVIAGVDGIDDTLPFTSHDGELVNSGAFSGLSVDEGARAITEELKKQGAADFKVNYRLRDWLVSRQRYWGAPIPIVYCDHCGGAVPVPEDQLPVELPYDVDFTPGGQSPLTKHEGFMHTTCPACGGPATRDADTLDTFVCSSWYFLRYPDNKNDEAPFDIAWIDKLLPVDMYVGGAEHACMHLLYARFFVKALRDMGYLHFDEPFSSLVHQGIILGTDGNKMSKSRGNVESPDQYVNEYGADILRMYLMFGFSYVEGGPWNGDGIRAVNRFVERVERFVLRSIRMRGEKGHEDMGPAEKELDSVRHHTISQVTQDMERFQFNTAIARMMELFNALYKYDGNGEVNAGLVQDVVRDAVLLLAPFIPHVAEELWETLGYGYSVHSQLWPKFDAAKLQTDEVEIAVQVLGKLRSRIMVDKDADEETVRSKALSDERIQQYVAGKTIVKFIYIPGRLANIVVR